MFSISSRLTRKPTLPLHFSSATNLFPTCIDGSLTLRCQRTCAFNPPRRLASMASFRASTTDNSQRNTIISGNATSILRSTTTFKHAVHPLEDFSTCLVITSGTLGRKTLGGLVQRALSKNLSSSQERDRTSRAKATSWHC